MSITRVCLALCLPSVLGACGGASNEPAPPATVEAFSTATAPAAKPTEAANLLSFNQALRKEPKVIDIVFNPAATVQWTVGVKDDGTPRHGFAEYLCSLMVDYKIDTSGKKVRIVDYAKFMQSGGSGRDASLGSVDCGSGEHLTP